MQDGSNSPFAPDSGAEVSLDAIPLHSTNLLTVLDENATVRYESPSIERIFGYAQEELVGEPVAEYFHPHDRDRVMGAFRTVVASEEYTVESAEYRHQRADGSYVWVESVASSDPTPDGGYVINTRDISEQKARARELERTNERLEAFAGVVSHDLRNPLNVAEGSLELAREECDSERLDTVARAHERMRELIDDLLAFARQGTPVEGMDPVGLADVVEASWWNVETADATLVVETDLTIRADRSRLQRLLENLMANAVEHGSTSPRSHAPEDSEGRRPSDSRASPDDAVEHEKTDVTVRIGELADGSGFYVADDGPGIPEGERETVFESGYSTSDAGTGFGLAIVREIADAHGWEIGAAESEAGGARFEITGVGFVDR